MIAISASMVGRSIHAGPAVVAQRASIIVSDHGVRSAAADHPSVNIISVGHSVNSASADLYANMDASDIIAIHAHL